MAYPLARMAKQGGDTRKSITLRAIDPTKALSDRLAKVYIRIVRVWRDAASDTILPVYASEIARLTSDAAMNDDTGPLEGELARAEAQAGAVIAAISIDVQAWEKALQDWHADKWVSSVSSGASIDVSLLISTDAVRDTLDATLQENLRLIRSISEEARERISGIIWRGYLARTPRRQIAKEINEAVKLGQARSLRIAVDQTTKLSAALDRARQEEAGITSFRWIHSHKKNFRPEHKARDGKIFSWSSAIARSDPPGKAPFCGCHSQPVLNLEDT